MPQMYQITDRKSGHVKRFVRANTLNAAVRAHANEVFAATRMSPEEMFQAMKAGDFDALDAVAPEQLGFGGGG
jgi:hypothetical protein